MNRQAAEDAKMLCGWEFAAWPFAAAAILGGITVGGLSRYLD